VSRSEARAVIFVVLAAAVATAAAIIATRLLQAPPARDLAIMAATLAATAAGSILVALLVRRFAHHLSFSAQLVAFAGVALVLATTNVAVAAGLMFLSRHDLELLFILLAFSLCAAGGPALLMGAHTGRRVAGLEAAAAAIAGGDLSARVAEPGRDALGRIANAFNGMAGALERSEERRREMESARRELFAAISHDLRTPLAAIRATVEALADGVVSDAETRERYLATAIAEADRLSLLVDDLFELATIDGGELRLHIELLQVEDVISEAVDAFRPQVEQKGISLAFERTSTCPVRADPQRLGRVLANLLQNALRHTPPDGTIVLQTALLDGAVKVVVSDSGEGIAEGDRERVFQRFYRGEKSRSREFGGSGLGLAIARGIVQAHGGNIWVEGGPGGATIAFTLPAA
jgi:signal transduction histidine kinase